MKSTGFTPDLKKCGSLRTMFDGRYKFTRYFAPAQRNATQPVSTTSPIQDIEFYDLHADPAEMTNLAAVKGLNTDVVMTCSTKLGAVIKAEIGIDDGREMPELPNINWQLDRMDL
jgi:arylsulfatase